MKKLILTSILCLLLTLLIADIDKVLLPSNNSRVDTLETINSFSQLGDFHTINYVGDYEEILDYLDGLYVGGLSQIYGEMGCSLFSGVGDSENIFFGRNFDNPQQDVLVGKYNSPGCYESIALNRLADVGLPLGTNFGNLTQQQKLLLLRSPYFAADGMNSMGIAAGLAYVQEVDVVMHPEKDTIFVTRWVREILDHAANVEEAIEISNSYNIIDNMFGLNTLCHHLLVTDSNGNSVILEYHDGQFMAISPEPDWQVLTNTPIYNVPLQQLFSLCYRYELLYNALQAQNGEIIDWRNGLDILDLPTWGNLYNGTQWSNLFDLNENVMYLSLYRDFDNIVQVDVENFDFRNYGDFYIIDQLEIDENNNGINEPGEIIELVLSLSVDFVSTGVSGTLTTSNPDITITVPTSEFGEINPDEIIMNMDDPFEIEILEEAIEQDVVLNLSLTTDYGYEFETEIILVIGSTSAEDDDQDMISDQIHQLQNYPNPFNPSTTISFSFTTENTESKELVIYNLKGQKIKQYSILNNQFSIAWDGTDLKNQPVSSGIYFYQLKVDGKPIAEKRCLLLK